MWNLVGAGTNGANVMTGTKSGVIHVVMLKNDNPYLLMRGSPYTDWVWLPFEL